MPGDCEFYGYMCKCLMWENKAKKTFFIETLTIQFKKS